jgi:hypothetical protein
VDAVWKFSLFYWKAGGYHIGKPLAHHDYRSFSKPKIKTSLSLQTANFAVNSNSIMPAFNQSRQNVIKLIFLVAFFILAIRNFTLPL